MAAAAKVRYFEDDRPELSCPLSRARQARRRRQGETQHMNYQSGSPTGGREARVRYLPGDLEVLSPGTFVRCAVTGRPVDLDDLRYWSHEVQEAYATAEIAFARYEQLRAEGRI